MKIEEKLLWKKCDNCSYLQYTSHLRCLNCKNSKFKLIISGKDISNYDIKDKEFKVEFRRNIPASSGRHFDNSDKYAIGSFWFSSLPIKIGKTLFLDLDMEYIYLPIKYPESKALEIERSRKNINLEICFTPTETIINDKIFEEMLTQNPLLMAYYKHSDRPILVKDVSVRLVEKTSNEILYEKKYK